MGGDLLCHFSCHFRQPPGQAFLEHGIHHFAELKEEGGQIQRPGQATGENKGEKYDGQPVGAIDPCFAAAEPDGKPLLDAPVIGAPYQNGNIHGFQCAGTGVQLHPDSKQRPQPPWVLCGNYRQIVIGDHHLPADQYAAGIHKAVPFCPELDKVPSQIADAQDHQHHQQVEPGALEPVVKGVHIQLDGADAAQQWEHQQPDILAGVFEDIDRMLPVQAITPLGAATPYAAAHNPACSERAAAWSRRMRSAE